jgi:uncharacterized RDD family membrane protein YckC
VVVSTPDQLTIDTPEQISLEFNLASAGSRFLALAIDTVLQAAGFLVLGLGAIGLSLIPALVAGSGAVRTWGLALLLLIGFVIYYGYFAIFEALWSGQTPGKRTIGLRVIGISGRPITVYEAILRNVVRIADQLPGIYAIGILSVFLTAKHQRLGDLAAATVVVHERPIERDAAVWETRAVRARYGAPRLAAEDVAVVEAFLRRRRELTDARREQSAAQIAEHIRNRLNVTTTDADEIFLEDVAAEYRASSRYL